MSLGYELTSHLVEQYKITSRGVYHQYSGNKVLMLKGSLQDVLNLSYQSALNHNPQLSDDTQAFLAKKLKLKFF